MKPKEKANEIVNQHFNLIWVGSGDISMTGIEIKMNRAKQCALFTVDEVINACEYNNVEIYNTDWCNKVKQEIEKL